MGLECVFGPNYGLGSFLIDSGWGAVVECLLLWFQFSFDNFVFERLLSRLYS